MGMIRHYVARNGEGVRTIWRDRGPDDRYPRALLAFTDKDGELFDLVARLLDGASWNRPRLLDLFCGAGGAAMGYACAGFAVTGVDIEPHDEYPFAFVRGDALAALRDPRFLSHFDAIHASPPCPRYSTATPAKNRDNHPDLIGPVRELLRASGLPYVIENVPGAPLEDPIKLCGSMFGLGVRRHRLFESNVRLPRLACNHASQPKVWGVYGDHGDKNPVTRPDGSSRGNKARDAAHAGEVMGIDWMTSWKDLADAIPPAYTEWIGNQLIRQCEMENEWDQRCLGTAIIGREYCAEHEVAS